MGATTVATPAVPVLAVVSGSVPVDTEVAGAVDVFSRLVAV